MFQQYKENLNGFYIKLDECDTYENSLALTIVNSDGKIVEYGRILSISKEDGSITLFSCVDYDDVLGLNKCDDYIAIERE